MDASNTLGRGIGSKKVKLIVDHVPNIVEKRYIPSVQELVAIKGIEKKTAETFVGNLPSLFKFFDDNGLYFGPKKSSNKNKSDASSEAKASPTASLRIVGNTFVFSGVRDKELEKFIADNGGSVSTSVSSKTTLVIVKEFDSDSGKVTKAKALNVPVMTLEDFKSELGL